MNDNANLHAHISTASSDCDGPQYNEWVQTMNDDERAEDAVASKRGYNNFSDLQFKERILCNHVSLHSEFGVTVKGDADGFFMNEPTEEGYRSAEVRWCTDEDCDTDERSHRDVFAEQMGY